ncbi:MAG: phosphoribosyltransferase [Candidatus Velthaea sp.]
MMFADRGAAGRALAERLTRYAGARTVVLALPRGGVPVAAPIARALAAPLEVFLVRKLGVPAEPELAMGAIASGGVRILNRDVIEELRIDAATVARVAAAEERELARRERAYRTGRARVTLAGATAIVVDDGAATGATMRVAVRAIRASGPAALVVALPVAVPEICRALRSVADDVVCLLEPVRLGGVGRWYERFEEVRDDDVRTLLGGA